MAEDVVFFLGSFDVAEENARGLYQLEVYNSVVQKEDFCEVTETVLFYHRLHKCLPIFFGVDSILGNISYNFDNEKLVSCV